MWESVQFPVSSTPQRAYLFLSSVGYQAAIIIIISLFFYLIFSSSEPYKNQTNAYTVIIYTEILKFRLKNSIQNSAAAKKECV